jgi:hypothetical protein
MSPLFQTRTRTEPSPLVQWLDRPRSQWWCVASWVVATAVFVGVTTLLGGLTQLDSLLSTYSSWSIAHGNVACAYPPGSSVYFPLTAPLYPVIAGGLDRCFFALVTAFPSPIRRPSDIVA